MYQICDSVQKLREAFLSLFVGDKIARTIGSNETNENWNSTDLNEIEIDTSGVFVGVSKAISVSKQGMFTFAAAASPMDTRISIEDTPAGDETVLKESAVGVSFNLAYNHILTGAFISSVGYKQQSFSYGGEIGSEDISSVYGKIAYRF